jgi:hypothetical protein
MKSTEDCEVDRQKVIDDSILVTRDTIHILQLWLELLESWRIQGQAEPAEFFDVCRQLQEAELWHWVRLAGGHGLDALAKAVGVEDFRLNDRTREGIQR